MDVFASSRQRRTVWSWLNGLQRLKGQTIPVTSVDDPAAFIGRRDAVFARLVPDVDMVSDREADALETHARAHGIIILTIDDGPVRERHGQERGR